MIYGYLRVSSDEQDVNSQKQGVDSFAQSHGWVIDEYISDEGVSGGKDPDKRKLGPLLKKINKADVVICSEISRLGRDLYMVMDILHFCMDRGALIYTVKDNFVLGDSIQSKVLAFAFGLAAEIERQMIRQRTKEGLRLRMKEGVLVGRPIGSKTADDALKLAPKKQQIIEQFKWGVPLRRLAENFNVDRNTISRYLVRWGVHSPVLNAGNEAYLAKQRALKTLQYKDEPLKVVPADRGKMLSLIETDKIIPEIAKEFPEYTYEQIYDTILADAEFNASYRRHGQLRIRKGSGGRKPRRSQGLNPAGADVPAGALAAKKG